MFYSYPFVMPIDKGQVVQFSKLELLAQQVVEGFITGLHKSPFHGFSVEFAEHRLYNKGESTKHIDWKLFGRTEKLFVKRYEEETNLRCQLVIDNSSSMYFPTLTTDQQLNKISFSVYCAAALIELLKKQRDAVGLSIFDEELSVSTPAKSSAIHHAKLFVDLEALTAQFDKTQASRASKIIQNLHTIAETTHKRSLIVIFSDMFDDEANEEAIFSALQHLKHNKHEVILFHVTDDSKELNFEFENRPYRFIDLETKQEVTLQGNSIQKDYQAKMQAYRQNLKLKCGAFKIDFVEADINQGFHQVLLTYLVKRNKML